MATYTLVELNLISLGHPLIAAFACLVLQYKCLLACILAQGSVNQAPLGKKKKENGEKKEKKLPGLHLELRIFIISSQRMADRQYWMQAGNFDEMCTVFLLTTYFYIQSFCQHINTRVNKQQIEIQECFIFLGVFKVSFLFYLGARKKNHFTNHNDTKK